MDNIKTNLTEINKRIAAAAEKSGRVPSDIILIGVTKTIEPERINRLVSYNVPDLGENKAQELLSKYEHVPDARWHFIGHLQTNKIKYIIDKVRMIHSVDSMKLAEEISKAAKKINKVMDVLIEVNVADEPSKYGVSLEKAREFSENIASFDGILLRGLMCVAPFVENPEENRHFFRKMYEKYLDIKENLGHNEDINCLSMGMTHDFDVAIEEGASIIRIGTGIFGERYT